MPPQIETKPKPPEELEGLENLKKLLLEFMARKQSIEIIGLNTDYGVLLNSSEPNKLRDLFNALLSIDTKILVDFLRRIFKEQDFRELPFKLLTVSSSLIDFANPQGSDYLQKAQKVISLVISETASATEPVLPANFAQESVEPLKEEGKIEAAVKKCNDLINNINPNKENVFDVFILIFTTQGLANLLCAAAQNQFNVQLITDLANTLANLIETLSKEVLKVVKFIAEKCLDPEIKNKFIKLFVSKRYSEVDAESVAIVDPDSFAVRVMEILRFLKSKEEIEGVLAQLFSRETSLMTNSQKSEVAEKIEHLIVTDRYKALEPHKENLLKVFGAGDL